MDVQNGNIQLLLVQLAELNIKVWADKQQLHINAPPGVLNDSLKQALREHRDALVDRLQRASNTKIDFEWPKITPDLEQRNKPFPLSDVQHAYWIGRSKGIELGDVATHYYYELSCDALDLERFTLALRRIIARHDMLRSVVDHDGRQQILQDVPPYEVPILDLRGLSPSEQDTQTSTLRAELSHQKLPTHQWPLFDIRAARLTERNTRLYFSWDFLNLDAWSLYIICREWNTLYADLGAALEPIDLSYRDYVLAEHAQRSGPLYKRDHDYWWNRIDTIPNAPMLPIRPATELGSKPMFTRRRFRLPREQWAKLKSKAQAIGVTPSGILLAAFSEILAYWSKQPHFSLNMTLFSRLPLHADVNKLVGDFTSLTLLEVDIRQRATFKERAIAIQKQFLTDFEHRLVSGVEVLREWAKRRGQSLQATMPVVFTSCLVLNSAEGDDAGLVESFGPMIYGISQTPQVWLDNQVMEDKEGLVFNWDALEDVFAADVLSTMFESYCRFLGGLADDASVWEQTHPLRLPLHQLEQRQAINATGAEVRDERLHDSFVQFALTHPDAIAVISSDRRMTYGELLARSTALAHTLRKHGLCANQLAAVAIKKSWEQVVAVFAILLAGGAYLPIDVELPEARRRQLFEQSGARIALVAAGMETALQLPADVACVSVWPDAPAHVLQAPLENKQQPGDLAYVIFTSGSTGVPKGVMIDHRAAVNTVFHVNRLFDINPSDRVLAVSSLSFDLSVFDIFGLLSVGGSVVVPDAERSTDPEHWLDLINRHNVTVWNSAPPLMTMLTSYMDGFQQSAATGVRLTLLSGDWIPVSLKSKTDVYFPNTRLISLGGATEASVWSIYYPIVEVDPQWKSIPYGKPLPNQTMHVLNEQLQACPTNVVGSIYIGGLGVARGYLNDMEKTTRHFITTASERLYYTGDLGRYLPDGNIEFLGREDAQIKLRGHRIELGEIAAVLRTHPAISEALAVVDGDSRSEQALWVYLQLNADQKSTVTTQVCASPEANQYSPAKLAEEVGEDEKILPITRLNQDTVDLWAGLDQLYFLALVQLFRTAQIFVADARYTLDGIAASLRTAPRYHRWLLRALRFLTNKGLLQEDGAHFSAMQPLPEVNLPAAARSIEQTLMKVLSLTEREARWFTLGAESLGDILSEATHSAELYTADETALIYQKLFPDSHLQLRRAVNAFVAKRRNDKLRVLEVGSGLGSATRHILPALAANCESYDFTDVSNYFLKKAKEKFSGYGFVQYRLYDLEKAPQYQGYEANSYDLIIASSVLHDVSDVEKTLVHLRSLLAPGGMLMLLEETKFLVSFDLTMGLQQGFDVFSDQNIRQHHPLLSRQQWCTALRNAGFADVEILNVAGSAADYVGFDVFVAQTLAAVETLDEEKLFEHLLRRLPAYMKPNGFQVLKEFPLSSNGKIDYRALARPSRRRVRTTNMVKPANELEQSLLEIWAEVLDRDDVGVNSSFFESGGDSLSLVEVRNQIKKKIGRHVPTTTLFEYPTIAGLAKYLGNETEPAADAALINSRAGRQKDALQRQRTLRKGARENV